MLSLKINIQSVRCICVCNILSKNGRFNMVQRSKLARKFFERSTPAIERLKLINKAPTLLKNSSVATRRTGYDRRLMRLDKIFTEKITDILLTSEIATKIVGTGLEIVEVQTQPHASAVKVYWMCSAKEHENYLNQVLTTAANYIGYELVFQKVIGKAPEIIFIKDVSMSNVSAVMALLEKADFGSKSENSEYLNEEAYHSVIKDFSTGNRFIDSEREVETPKMRQDVFGVDRDKIMNDVKKAAKLSKALHRKTGKDDTPVNALEFYPTSLTPNSSSNYSRTGEIRKWINKYSKLRKKAKKGYEKFDNQMISYTENVNSFSESDNFFPENDIEDYEDGTDISDNYNNSLDEYEK